MNLCFKIIILLISVFNIKCYLQLDYLPVLEGLNIKSPYYIADKYDIKYKHLLKHHFQKQEASMLLCSTKSAADIPKTNKEKISSIVQAIGSNADIGVILEPLLSFEFPTVVLLITNSSQLTNMSDLEIQIHQQILFYFEDTQELFEAYKIHNSNIVRRLGLLTGAVLLWEENINSNFVQRRSNFQGVTLKVMVEFEGFSINANPIYQTNAPYFPENETYLLNGFTYGVFQDVLDLLQDHLNFSAQIFKRKDGQWGMVYPQEDGTFKTVGFIGDLFLKKADFAIGNVIIFQNRAQFVDYLPKVGIYQGNFKLKLCFRNSFALSYLLKIGGVYLPSLEASERIDWIAFLRPFQWTPWLLIVFSTLISSIVSAIIWFIRGTLTFRKSIKIIWTNVQAFFDEASDFESKWTDLRFSHRLATLISLLWAWFIWTSYNAALASEFTVPIVKLPFTDMESLSTTDYR